MMKNSYTSHNSDPVSPKPSIPRALLAGLTSSPSAFHAVPDELLDESLVCDKANLLLVSPEKARRESPPITPRASSKASRRLSFCQDGVSNATREGVSLSNLANTLSQHGWLRSPDNKLKQPIDVVEFDDGEVVTLDHRRVVAACQDNVARVFCKVHHASDRLSRREQRRFRFKDGSYAATYGQAVEARCDQNRLRKTPSSELPVIRVKKIAAYYKPGLRS